MDPLGAALSVGSIVELCKIATGISLAFKEIHNTTLCEDVERLHQLLCALSSAFEESRDSIASLEREGKNSISGELLERLQKLVRKSHSHMELLKWLADRGKIEKDPDAMSWVWYIPATENLRQRWERRLPEIRAVCSRSLKSSYETISAMGHSPISLSCPRFVFRKEEITGGAASLWVPSSTAMHRWCQEEGPQSFWITGAPGSGKSSILKEAIREHVSSRNLERFREFLFPKRWTVKDKAVEKMMALLDLFDGSAGRHPADQIEELKITLALPIESSPRWVTYVKKFSLYESLPQPRSDHGRNSSPIFARKIIHGQPATYKGFWNSDPNQHTQQYLQERSNLDRFVAAPACLISLTCALCMHNYDANRHDQHAGYFMHPISIWSAIENPSPPMLVAATMMHGMATLTYYTMRPADKLRESFLGVGLLSAVAVGYGIGADVENVLIGILPIVTTISLLLCTLTNVLLRACGAGNNLEIEQEMDLEKFGK